MAIFTQKRPPLLYPLFILLALLAAGAQALEPASTPLAPRSKPPGGKTLFTELPAARSGIRFVNPIDTNHALKRLYTSAFGGGGGGGRGP